VRTFHCSNCRNLVLFENTQCVRCQHRLAYAFDDNELVAVDRDDHGGWHALRAGARAESVRLCHNYETYAVCNGIARPEASEGLCPVCEVTRTIPNLARPGNREAWQRLESAKSRLLYTLRRLGLTWRTREEDPEHGLAFDFLSDDDTANDKPVIIGHDEGVITLSVQEADDAVRENRRQRNRENYRTLLGHFRHEIGHFYWDVLIRDAGRIDAFRALFGDERHDYGEALDRHYAAGPPSDWPDHFISAYASAHPWEDWAESFAHYLHMTDVLEIADDAGLELRPRGSDAPRFATRHTRVERERCDDLLGRWSALTFVLNNLNRGMGLHDLYPFVLNAASSAKLRFVHDEIAHARKGTGRAPRQAGRRRTDSATAMAAD
jgi:hypothetical protein